MPKRRLEGARDEGLVEVKTEREKEREREGFWERIFQLWVENWKKLGSVVVVVVDVLFIYRST
jgi:hypothetical protein